MKDKKKGLPEHLGKIYNEASENKFEGNIPNAIKEALNIRLYMAWIGSAFMLQRNEWKRVIKTFSTIIMGAEEEDNLRKERFKGNLGLKENLLAGATDSTAKKYNWIAIIALICEYIVFQNLGENVFGFSFFASLAFGLIVVVITLGINITIKPFMLTWIRSVDFALPSKVKKVLFIYCGLIILFLIVSGTANYFDKDYVRLDNQVKALTTQINDLEKKEMDTKVLKEQREVLKTKMAESESTFAKILKILAYAMIGFICVIGSAIATVLAEEAKRIVLINKKILETESRLAKVRAKLKYMNSVQPEIKRTHLEIIRMFGQKDLLEKLLTPNQCEALKIT